MTGMRDPETCAEVEAAIICVALQFQSARTQKQRTMAWRRLQELNAIKSALNAQGGDGRALA